jgi:hypothetical protein
MSVATLHHPEPESAVPLNAQSRFRVTWEFGAYRVSPPKHDGGDVVRAEVHDAMVHAHREELRHLIATLRGAIDGYTRGAFSGWTGKTGQSRITLDQAGDHLSLCMRELMDAFDGAAAKFLQSDTSNASLRETVAQDVYASLEQQLDAAGCLALTDEGLEAFKHILIGGISHSVGLSAMADPSALTNAHTALKSFAAQAAYWPEKNDGDTLTTCDPEGDCCALDFTVGDLRRAAALLDGHDTAQLEHKEAK